MLQLHYVVASRHYHLAKEAFFHRKYLLLCSENLLLVFLQLLSDVSFCLCQRLLSNPVGRYLVLVCIADLQIVSENIIITYLQTADARLLHLTLLYAHQVVLAVSGDRPQLVQLAIHSVTNDISLANLLRRILLQLTVYLVAQVLTQIQLVADVLYRGNIGIHASLLHGLKSLQGRLQLHHLPRSNSACSHLGYNTFEVAHPTQTFVDYIAKISMSEEVFHPIQPLVYQFLIL